MHLIRSGRKPTVRMCAVNWPPRARNPLTSTAPAAVPKTATRTQSTGAACPLLVEIDFPFQWLNQSIVGTVTAKAKVETRSIEAASDSTALQRAAKSTDTVA